ncbi:unnamed protein product [Cyclocybe aegerita]|uniref:Uncharacterized protein n=1 Tax=Cyclocybe aegerita TaxID=1973307 RepID=A0A8S0W1V1_CYCAE|nr:unnamed protein product [Cyclocybe aegerita]
MVQLLDPTGTLLRPSVIPKRFKPFSSKRNWVEYDNTWREIRGAANSGDHATIDSVRGLAWVDKHLGQSLDTVFAVYHCMEELRPMEAAHVVALNNEKIDGHLFSDSMKSVMGDMSDNDCHETVSSLFLEENCRAFPQLGQCLIESTVRFLNSRMVTNNEDNIADSLPVLHWPLRLHYMRGMPADLVSQSFCASRS